MSMDPVEMLRRKRWEHQLLYSKLDAVEMQDVDAVIHQLKAVEYEMDQLKREVMKSHNYSTWSC